MSDVTFNTVVLQDCLKRMHAGDRDAENDLIKAVQSRLRRLAAQMFRRFPNVRGIADLDDVIQNSTVSLLRSLRKIKPPRTRDFMNFAAVHIQRELINLARRAKKKRTVRLNLGGSTDAPGLPEPAEPEDSDMDVWVELHLAIDQLPSERREVVHLVLYHGWKQEQIAELLQINVRTVRRHLAAARESIRMLARIEKTTARSHR